MYLKRLELSGFKSFPKKTTLEFENPSGQALGRSPGLAAGCSPITAIVGPNGSGKSNITEAIRFVLGEQSMKSLRGKSGPDLIFKGSKTVPEKNRAFISAVFDNRDRILKIQTKENRTLEVDFDEITISREVYRDGSNSYKVNGTEVRLKDILEMLAGVNIGSSGHHIISQGEADRILSANPKERREMIEDALGLRIYKFRLKESQRKMTRTRENLRETELLRREIAPHLKFLSRQVNKIKKAEELRGELKELCQDYFSKEKHYLLSEKERIESEKEGINQKLAEIEDSIQGAEKFDIEEEIKKIEEEIDKITANLRQFRDLKDTLSRELGKIEVRLELEKEKEEKETVSLSGEEVLSFLDRIESKVKEALEKKELGEIKDVLRNIAEVAGGLRKLCTESGEGGVQVKDGEIREKQQEVLKELENIKQREIKLENRIKSLRGEIEERRSEERKKNKVFYELKMQENTLSSKKELVEKDASELLHREKDFEEELREAQTLVGSDPTNMLVGSDPTNAGFLEEQEKKKRKIERLKIRLEEAGGAGGGEVMKEYEETRGRDEFLAREVRDLKESIESLENLMAELEEKIDSEFKEGIGLINEEFQKFFKLMFDGGSASLSLRRGQDTDRTRTATDTGGRGLGAEENIGVDQIENQDGSVADEVEGIEINVSLPRKRAKDLHVLSGGERALTSITLLFALTQVNPPPFLVLDETDAALDEANSCRYGDLLEQLSKQSQLILVTHNRETMSHAHVLYGVTMTDGVSRLLSVKFDEAVEIAK